MIPAGTAAPRSHHRNRVTSLRVATTAKAAPIQRISKAAPADQPRWVAMASPPKKAPPPSSSSASSKKTKPWTRRRQDAALPFRDVLAGKICDNSRRNDGSGLPAWGGIGIGDRQAAGDRRIESRHRGRQQRRHQIYKTA